jgi:ribosomal-protein-alanine N-acetyltransferase
MNLRAYEPEDLDALYALDVACFAPTFRFSRSAMRRFAQAANARVVVAEVAAEIVGFCILHVERDGAERMGYIVTLDIDPGHRREGIAQALMVDVERQACEAGCAALALHVYRRNEAAMAFYAAIGFGRVGVEPDFYGRGLDAELWRKATHCIDR